MVVHVPPSRVENPMGINTEEAFIPVRKETLIKMGRNNTTTGTLFINALIKAPTTRVSSREMLGLTFQKRVSTLPTGSSAPVRTIPCPAIIRAQTATSASCPKPRKKSTACKTPPSTWKGKTSNPTARPMSTRKLEDSRGIFLRVNRIRATTAKISTARAWALGGGGRVNRITPLLCETASVNYKDRYALVISSVPREQLPLQDMEFCDYFQTPLVFLDVDI